MVYRIDNRPKKHRGRYTILGIILGISITIAGLYLYDNNKPVILDNANQIKNFAIKQIPKDSPIIQLNNNDKPIDNDVVQSQPVGNSQSPQKTVVSINTLELEKQIHDQINIIRNQAGLKSLSYDDKVAEMAREHSQDMAMNNYFDHTSLDGKTFQDRIISSQIACYPAGENIEQNYQSETNLLDSVIQTWMNSPEHKQNILSSFYSSEGIGIVTNNDNILITDDFC